MTSSGFLLLAAICFALIYGLFRLIRAAEDKSREIGFYYGFVGLFAHLAVPVLALYNGQRGPSPRVNTVMKWLFYLYYPAHLALIGWLQMQ